MLKVASNSVEETQNIAKQFAQELYLGTNIFLFGKMGAGKTQFVRAFLEYQNINLNNFSSPTYTLTQHYKKEEEDFLHVDLYRLENTEDIGLDEYFLDNNTTVLCEWSEKLKTLPKPRIEVHFKKVSELKREIQFIWIGFSLSQEQIQALIKEYKTPLHVQKHSACVTTVSCHLADQMIQNGYIIDKESIRQAALLHDLVRYIDFKGDFTQACFPNPIDDETWKFWLKMREKHKGKHHADLASDILSQQGFSFLGKIITAHKSNIIFKGFLNTYEKILHYADKRCKHDTITSLEERLQDLQERYGEDVEKQYWDGLFLKNIELEKELKGNFLNFEEK